MLYGLLSVGKSFKPDKDIPDLNGKVILVTGGNIGLGKESVLQLSKHNPAHIYLSARSKDKAEAAIEEIKSEVPDARISFIECDLASLNSVKKAAQEFLSKEKRLDVLMLNAGVMALPPGTTKEGYEIQFGTNHVGHFLFTKLLMPVLLKTAEETKDVRVVALSSIGHTGAPSCGILFDSIKTDQASISTWTRYGQSKLANILFARELARQCPSITAVAVHPGIVATNLYSTFEGGMGGMIGKVNALAKRIAYQTPQSGARGQMWAATAPLKNGEVESGEYYTPIGVTGQGSKISRDMELAKKLWDWTEEEVKEFVN